MVYPKTDVRCLSPRLIESVFPQRTFDDPVAWADFLSARRSGTLPLSRVVIVGGRGRVTSRFRDPPLVLSTHDSVWDKGP